ncbi:hypothetical protein [Bradyrhizobium sp. Gha]|uniref:hypothetical protein n=1 Tax=Bradyrhizobium sp. Gha TaxID=1855318 RepID=UPI0008E8FF32|nr:hypothetical protein [Bradyrhizobium sp. Gha]SFI21429.1 hypothetical protein SAMN05216525_1063 [Bradyrhizobium sp. Gha]
MLPGFRFLLAAILLSTSILVFGLGATSLLRATHEQYVSNPSWRNGPQEQVFAQGPEPAEPVLATLRVEPAAPVAIEATSVVPDQVPTIALPAVETGPEQMAAVTLAAQPEPQVTAVAPDIEAAPVPTEAPAPEPAKSEAAAPSPTDTLTPADTTASIAAIAPAPTMSATDVPRTATPALASRVSDIAAARLAALNELAPTSAKKSPAKSKADGATQSSKPRAHKPKKRHRIVRRPPPQQLQQALDPFGQQQQTLATTAARTR